MLKKQLPNEKTPLLSKTEPKQLHYHEIIEEKFFVLSLAPFLDDKSLLMFNTTNKRIKSLMDQNPFVSERLNRVRNRQQQIKQTEAQIFNLFSDIEKCKQRQERLDIDLEFVAPTASHQCRRVMTKSGALIARLIDENC